LPALEGNALLPKELRMSHCNADAGQLTPRSRFYDEGRFGRLFPTLPPFAADTPLIRDALMEIGARGGLLDAGDDLSDPITLITDPAKSVNNPNNPTLTAGSLSANDSVGQMAYLPRSAACDPRRTRLG
jgi:hypothetical protein